MCEQKNNWKRAIPDQVLFHPETIYMIVRGLTKISVEYWMKGKQTWILH